MLKHQVGRNTHGSLQHIPTVLPDVIGNKENYDSKRHIPLRRSPVKKPLQHSMYLTKEDLRKHHLSQSCQQLKVILQEPSSFKSSESMSSGIVSDESSNLSPADTRFLSLPRPDVSRRRSDRFSTESTLSVHFGATEVHVIPRYDSDSVSQMSYNIDNSSASSNISSPTSESQPFGLQSKKDPITTDFVDIDVDTILDNSFQTQTKTDKNINTFIPTPRRELQICYFSTDEDLTSDYSIKNPQWPKSNKAEQEAEQAVPSVNNAKSVNTNLTPVIVVPKVTSNSVNECKTNLPNDGEKRSHFLKWWSELSVPQNRTEEIQTHNFPEVVQNQIHNKSAFSKLSDGLILNIFSYLTNSDNCRNSRVCKRWYKLVWNPLLWTNLYLDRSISNVNSAVETITKILSYQGNSYPKCNILTSVRIHSSNSVTDQCIVVLAQRCPNLSSMELINTPRITNLSVYELLQKCPKLTSLKINNCNQVNKVMIAVNSLHESLICTNLTCIDLSRCDSLSDEGVSSMSIQCPRLKKLVLHHCQYISDLSLISLGRHCSALQELSLTDNQLISDSGLGRMSYRIGHNLRHLSLAACQGVTDKGLQRLSRYSGRLRYLNVGNCPLVTDMGLEQLISKNGHSLLSVDFSYCDVSDEVLILLAKKCANLKRLSVRGCDTVTDQGALAIAAACSSLTLLNVLECSVSSEVISVLRKQLPKCILHYQCVFFC